MVKGIIFFAGILIVSLLFFFRNSYGNHSQKIVPQQYEQRNTKTAKESSPLTATTSSQTGAIFDTWKVYKTDTYHFEIRYPESLIVKEIKEEQDIMVISFEAITIDSNYQKVGGTAPIFQIEIYGNKKYLEIEKFCKDMREEGAEPSACYRILSPIAKSQDFTFLYYNPSGPGLSSTPSDFQYPLYKIGDMSISTFNLSK